MLGWKRVALAVVACALTASFAACGSSNSSNSFACPALSSGCSLPTAPPGVQISDFGGLTSGGKPADLALGPDGNMWFTEQPGGRIGRITPGGTVSEYLEPTPNQPTGITVGPDGNLWAAGLNALDRVSTSGAITQFIYPTAAAGGGEITTGPDGRLWFAETLAGKIGVATTAGAIVEYALGTNSQPLGMTLDPNRQGVWCTLFGTNQIALIGPSGAIAAQYTIPTANSQPISIVGGPDGGLWFAEFGASKIGRVTTTGQFTEFSLPAGTQPNAITVGSDGRLWFVEYGTNRIGAITTGGSISEYPIPTASSGPVAIRPGVGRSLWFAEFNAVRIGLVSY